MAYRSLEDCLLDLEKTGRLRRVKEQVDPNLQMAAIHLRVYEAGGPALLFENVKGSNFRAASNIFGSIERSEYIFRNSFQSVQQLVSLKNNPLEILKHPLKNAKAVGALLHALPLKNPLQKPVLFREINISNIPLIKHWPKDGGAFVTLPQVYTEDIEKPGIMNSNLGMYRIQLNGNDYEQDKEIGLHYQIHRGIGVHQAKANKQGKPLSVSVFIGGPPAHSVAAVMPLPEGMSELTFAGALAGRRFRYCYRDGYCISTDADFVITGWVMPGENKPEGPFGDHLGYYSLTHLFPVMKVHKIYARKNAIWPFTVVGRPPQEDTAFGELIHRLAGKALPVEIPGLKQVNAVDAAGVHPLLLAIGSERYTPFTDTRQPAEILTIANHILGKGQLSLAKFLFITADESGRLDCNDIPAYFTYVLERLQKERDIHFYTHTSIDTLDYSGTDLNKGSKVVIAAYGAKKYNLTNTIPAAISQNNLIKKCRMVMPGIAVIETNNFSHYIQVASEMDVLTKSLELYLDELEGLPLLILADDANFVAEKLNNFLWVSFTRCNPAYDMYGVADFVAYKHWGCKGPLIIDARIKPHHAPPLLKDAAIEKSIDPIFEKGGSLYGVLK